MRRHSGHRAKVTELLHQYRIVVAGPTTLAALLNSLRMGFQTLAIEKRSSEVWEILAAVKTEFGKFGEVMDKLKRQLDTASRRLMIRVSAHERWSGNCVPLKRFRRRKPPHGWNFHPISLQPTKIVRTPRMVAVSQNSTHYNSLTTDCEPLRL